MNCGEHEGQVGVSVCHYDGVTNTVEEMLFVPTTLSYEIVKEQIGKLMYVSEQRCVLSDSFQSGITGSRWTAVRRKCTLTV